VMHLKITTMRFLEPGNELGVCPGLRHILVMKRSHARLLCHRLIPSCISAMGTVISCHGMASLVGKSLKVLAHGSRWVLTESIGLDGVQYVGGSCH
jgi:hypothetical protein